MADDLQITASFDVTPLTEGLQQFADSLRNTASQSVDLFSQMAGAGSELETTFSNLSAAIVPASASIEAVGSSASDLITSLTGISTEAEAVVPQLQATAEVVVTLSEALQAGASGGAALIELLTGIGAASEDASSGAQAEAAAVSEMDVALLEMATAQNAATAEIAAAIAAQEAYAAGLQDSGLAAMQQAQTTVEGAVASTEAAQAVKSFNITLGEGVVASQALTDALNLLNSAEATSQVSAQQINEAWTVVNQQLQRLGLQLIKTAEGYSIVAAASNTASLANDRFTASLTQTDRVLGYLAGRSVAYATGVGQLGFALGILGRTIAPLNQLLIAAFPIVSIVLFAEIVQSTVNKLSTLQDEIRKTSAEFADLAAQMEHSADSTELQNLKLEDQIDKFEGRPASNQVAEAALEAKIKVDQLIKSLEDATEKEISLFEKAQTGLLAFLTTGAAPTTTGIEALDRHFGLSDVKIKDIQRQYSVAIENQRAAQREFEDNDTDANAKARDAANARVTDLQDALEKEARAQLAGVEQSKKIALERIKAGQAGALEPHTADEVNAAYANQEKNLLSIINLTESEKRLQKETADEIKTQAEEGAAAQAAAARKSALELDQPRIKAQEEEARLQASIAKTAAENKLREAEAGMKQEIALAEESGKSRAQAEVEFTPQIITAQKELTTAELAELKARYDATHSALEQQRADYEKYEVGNERVIKLTAVNAELRRLDEQYTSDKASIISRGNVTVENLESADGARRAEIARKAAQDIVKAAEDEVKGTSTVAKDTAGEEIAVIKDAADIKLGTLRENELQKTLTTQQGRDARLAIINQEEADEQAALEKQKTSIENQQAYITSLLATAPLPSIAGLLNIYNELEVQINKVTVAQQKLNSEFGKQRASVDTAFYANQLSSIDNFVNQASSQFESLGFSLLQGMEPTQRILFKVEQQIEKEFYDMIVKMIEDTTIFRAIQDKFRDAFTAIFAQIGLIKVPPITGLPATPAPTAAGLPGAVPVGAPPVAGTVAAAGVTTGQSAAQTAATTQATTSLTTLSAAASQNAAVQTTQTATKTTDTSATAAGVAAKTTDTAATAAGAGAKTADTAATTAHTTATNSNIVVMVAHRIAQLLGITTTHAHTAAKVADTSTTIASTTTTAVATAAKAAETPVIIAATAAQAANVGAVAVGTAAQFAFDSALFVDMGSMLAHVTALYADTAALIAHTIAAGFAEGGVIPSTGFHYLHEGERVLSVEQRTAYERAMGGGSLASKATIPARLGLSSGLAESGSRGDSGGSAVALHYHAGDVNALDRSGFEQVLSNHPEQLAKFVTKLARQGRINTRNFR